MRQNAIGLVPWKPDLMLTALYKEVQTILQYQIEQGTIKTQEKMLFSSKKYLDMATGSAIIANKAINNMMNTDTN